MKISIIIPTYNRVKLISETIDSVLAQSNPNWECIIVDDGSTDNTVAVLKEYASKDDRIKVFERGVLPKGANACRNIGAKKSTGEYLIFLDSDDLIAPWSVEKRLAAVAEAEEKSLYIFPGANLEVDTGNLTLYYPDKGDDFLQNFLGFKRMFQTSSSLWHRDYIAQIKFDENLPCWQDCDVHIRGLLNTEDYKAYFTMPDFFIRKQNIKYSQVTSGYNLEFAVVLHNYAWNKIGTILNDKDAKLFRLSYLGGWTNLLEVMPYEESKPFLKVAIEGKFFKASQKRKLNAYYQAYNFFRRLKLPNIAYRTRKYFGIPRVKTSNIQIKDDERSLLIAELEKHEDAVTLKFLKNKNNG